MTILKLILWVTIFWLPPYISKIQKNEANYKKNLLVGVTMPACSLEDDEVKAALNKYKKETSLISYIMLICIIPQLFLNTINLIVFFYGLWIDAAVIVFYIPYISCNKKLKEIKIKNNWITQKVSSEKVVIDTNEMPKLKWASPWSFLIPALISIFPAIVHENLRFISIINTFDILLFYICCRFCIKRKTEWIDKNFDNAIKLSMHRNSLWSKVWQSLSNITAIFSFSCIFLLDYPEILGILIVIYTLVIAFVILKAELKIRKIQESINSNTQDEIIDEDSFWIYGIFYYNKNDSNILVNQRTGMGTTLNFAKGISKIIAIFTIICLVLVPVSPMLLDISIESDISINLNDKMLYVSCGKDKWIINEDEIESLELLYEYPEKLSRSFGTSTDKIQKGNYTAKDMKILKVCFNPDSAPYLLVKDKQNKYYMFGTKEAGIIDEIYKKLSEDLSNNNK